MLTVTFPGHPKARVIVVDEPVNGVSGIVECDVCPAKLVLTVTNVAAITEGIERFIKEHECEPLARLDEVIALGARLKESMPGGSVRITKGDKLIKEL